MSDVLRLARSGRLPDVDVARLPLILNGEGCREAAEFRREFYAALIVADETKIRALFIETYQGGMAVATLADYVIRPVLHRLGHEWTQGRIDVLHEHHGLQVCFSALYELKRLLLESAASEGPLALGGSPEKDNYLLPCLLAEMVLIDSGWSVINLGPNTPLASFERALGEFRPRMLWLSISHLENPVEFLESYRHLQETATRLDVAVVVGGRALEDRLRAAMPSTTFGDGMKHLASFARALYPQSRPPQRGRPRSDRAETPSKRRKKP
jgi:methanogenic corrinoid protein MtbC1